MIQEAWIGRSVTGPTARLAKNKPAGPPHRGQEVMKPRWASVLAGSIDIKVAPPHSPPMP
jgi:hypothetical protein